MPATYDGWYTVLCHAPETIYSDKCFLTFLANGESTMVRLTTGVARYIDITCQDVLVFVDILDSLLIKFDEQDDPFAAKRYLASTDTEVAALMKRWDDDTGTVSSAFVLNCPEDEQHPTVHRLHTLQEVASRTQQAFKLLVENPRAHDIIKQMDQKHAYLSRMSVALCKFKEAVVHCSAFYLQHYYNATVSHGLEPWAAYLIYGTVYNAIPDVATYLNELRAWIVSAPRDAKTDQYEELPAHTNYKLFEYFVVRTNKLIDTYNQRSEDCIGIQALYDETPFMNIQDDVAMIREQPAPATDIDVEEIYRQMEQMFVKVEQSRPFVGTDDESEHLIQHLYMVFNGWFSIWVQDNRKEMGA